MAATLGPLDHPPGNVTTESRINDLTALRSGSRLAHSSENGQIFVAGLVGAVAPIESTPTEVQLAFCG